MAAQRLPVRLFNRLGRLRSAKSFADAEEALLAQARAAAGADDFGDPGFREGLRTLLVAYDEEARLSPFGRFIARAELVGILRSRLEVVAAWKREPAVLDAPIRRPIFVLGLPRTGTTALHFLLGQDPASQVLEYWIASAPRPRPPRGSWSAEPRFVEAARGLKMSYWLDPGLRAIHDLRPDGPEECRHRLLQSFTDDTFDSNASVPSYTAWFAGRDMRPSYAWHRDVLKLVQSSAPGRRWILKYPAHLKHLHVLLETYPDACIVQTHRDPAEVLPSLCSLVTRWRGIYEDGVDVAAVARWQVEMWAERLAHAQRVRAGDDPERYCDLDFREVVEDPLRAVRRIYDHFGLELTREAERRMRAFAQANPSGRHGGHRYSAEEFGLSAGELRERFADYRAGLGAGAGSPAGP